VVEGTVFAANLERLMAYAAKHHDKRLASPEALEEASGVSRSNIYRYLAQETSPTLEKLEGIARAFDLMAWQLLVPHLDPANPPVVFVTPEERALYDSIRTVGLQARNLEGAIATDTVTSPAGPDTHRTTKTTLKKRGRPAKTRFP
jgi:transcriptional regulator with XRE-family HTH domain